MTDKKAESFDALVRAGFKNPDEMLRQIKIKKAESSLIDFIEYMWDVLEPGREFKRGKVVEVLCEHLEAVTRGEIKRLVINVPPGCMKSLTTSVFWPIWSWISRPSMRFVAFAYAEHLTMRDNTKARRLLESEKFIEAWGDKVQLDPKERSKGKFATKQTGFKLATSISGVGTGERGDCVIIDDPHNVKEGESEAKRNEALMWFGETLPTRVNDAEHSAMILIMQRVHEADISGHILENLPHWDRLILPMRYEPDHPTPSRTALEFEDWREEDGELLWPERFPESAQAQVEAEFRAVGGEYAVAGQMQQRPAPRDGGMFKRDHFQVINASEVPTGGSTVRGWDLAASKDGRAAWTVGVRMRRVVMGDKVFYIIEDVVRGRLSPFQVDQTLLECAARDGLACVQDLPQDPGQAGKSQVAHFAKLLDGYSFRFGLESGSKEDRARPLSSQGEAGNLFMVRAPWNATFLAEAENFPNGRYLDQVDAMSRAYARLLRSKPRTLGAAPETVG